MSHEDSQIVIPPSFVDLFVPVGSRRPGAPRDAIAERYELCEDMAQMLQETARTRLFELGVTEADVLERIHRGLLQQSAQFGAGEAAWVTCRLAELLEWAVPAGLLPPGTRIGAGQQGVGQGADG